LIAIFQKNILNKYIKQVFVNAINITNLPVEDLNEHSCGAFVYSKILSTDVIWFSNSAVCRIPNWTKPASPQVCEIARPTFPPNVASMIINYY